MTSRLRITFAAAALGLSAIAGAQTNPSEFTRNQNEAAPKQGTHASRSAERKAQRAEVKAENKAGEIQGEGDDWGMTGHRTAKADGTHESRKAERKAKRAEIAQANKAGQLPVSDEAEVARQKP